MSNIHTEVNSLIRFDPNFLDHFHYSRVQLSEKLSFYVLQLGVLEFKEMRPNNKSIVVHRPSALVLVAYNECLPNLNTQQIIWVTPYRDSAVDPNNECEAYRKVDPLDAVACILDDFNYAYNDFNEFLSIGLQDTRITYDRAKMLMDFIDCAQKYYPLIKEEVKRNLVNIYSAGNTYLREILEIWFYDELVACQLIEDN